MRKCLVSILLASAVIIAGQAAAAPAIPLGARLGYTHDDGLDQFHVGGHARVAEFTRNVFLQPSVELGFGDDATLLAFNGDLFYDFTEFATSQWTFYAGGGIVLSYFERGGFDDWNFGLDLAGGAGYHVSPGTRVFGEIRIGLEDTPDLKLTAGVTFF
ncbi:MAG: hypothetical protein R6X25_03280 [Candidatus Krumholzibacteriia bacterium]